MLKKSLLILVTVALLCGTAPFSSQEASAFIDCSNAWQRCYDARGWARLVCSIAIVEPTPVGETACVAALAYAAGVCSYAYFWCGG